MTSSARLLFLLVAPLTLWSQRSGDFLLVDADRASQKSSMQLPSKLSLASISIFAWKECRGSQIRPCSASMDTRMAHAANTTGCILQQGY
jgi:hypothetical protein